MAAKNSVQDPPKVDVTGITGGTAGKVITANTVYFQENPPYAEAKNEKEKELPTCDGITIPCATKLKKNSNYCRQCGVKIPKTWFNNEEDVKAAQKDLPSLLYVCAGECNFTSVSSFPKCDECETESQGNILCPFEGRCNAKIDDGCRFCQKCRNRCQANYKGRRCLTYNEPGDTFCATCGHYLKEGTLVLKFFSIWKIATRSQWSALLRGDCEALTNLKETLLRIYNAILIEISTGCLVFTFLHDTKEQAQSMMEDRGTVLKYIHNYLEGIDSRVDFDHVELFIQVKTESGQVINRHHGFFTKTTKPSPEISDGNNPAVNIRSIDPSTTTPVDQRPTDHSRPINTADEAESDALLTDPPSTKTAAPADESSSVDETESKLPMNESSSELIIRIEELEKSKEEMERRYEDLEKLKQGEKQRYENENKKLQEENVRLQSNEEELTRMLESLSLGGRSLDSGLGSDTSSLASLRSRLASVSTLSLASQGATGGQAKSWGLLKNLRKLVSRKKAKSSPTSCQRTT